MFGRLQDIVNNAKDLSYLEGLFFVFKINKNAQALIELNTGGRKAKYFQDGQLWSGVNANEVDLFDIGGGYSFTTIQNKKEFGLPTDRVTLFDTGEFYFTFNLFVKNNQLLLSADTIKENEQGERIDLQDRWGQDIIGLSENSIEKLANFIAQDFVKWLIKEILSV